MSNRSVFVAACVLLAASVSVFGQASGNAYLFQVPPINSGSSQILGYAANTINFASPVINAPGPTGTFQIIFKPDGTKVYLVGANSVQAADPGFVNFRPVNGITGAPTSAAMSPNGKYLLVGAGSPNGNLYVIDTSTDQVLGSPPTTSGTVVQQYGIAVTQDSKRAFVLANNSFGSALTAYDLTTQQRVGPGYLALGGAARAITLSPLGLLYVARGNGIDEIDPATVALTATQPTLPNAVDPGPVRFTSDGTTAYFVNHNPSIGGVSLFKLTLATHAITTWSSNVVFDDVYIAGNSRIFAWSSQSTTLYDVNPSPLGATVSALSSVVSVANVQGIAVSTELPSARYLFLEVTNGQQISLNRVDLTRNALDLTGSSTVGVEPLVYVAVPPVSGAGAFIQYNNLQTLTAGTTSLPLVALVLDSAGRPVFNQAVTFTTDPANGAVINTANAITNANGYVQTTVTVPSGSAGGTFTITLTAGAASVTFTLTVPGTGGGGGGGGGGGTSQVTIVSGDGQLLYSFAIPQPMTIKVTDTSGKPLSGVAVSFSTAQGNTVPNNPNTTTDSNGLASSTFSYGPPPFGQAFLANSITASTPYGTVSFTETAVPSQNILGQPIIQPEIDLDSPGIDTGRIITIPAGSVVPNAVVARIFAAGSPDQGAPPIPGIGISVVNPDFTPSPAASCKGDPLSDQNGKVSCNLVGACLAPGTYTPVIFWIGNFVEFSGAIKTVTGSAARIQKLAGDNQSGRAGQQLPTSLLAVVTDGCGTPVAGAQVTWTVTQGSATLVGSATTTTDSSGRATKQLTFGQTPGTVQVRVAFGSAQAVFTLTNQVVVSSLSVVSGNNQTAIANQAFAQPLVVSVLDNSNNPVSGISVTFSVSGGSASVNPTGATTDAQGRASTTATAGATAGPVTIIASYSTFNATFTLTVRPPGPVLTANSFLSAAFNTMSNAAPGLVPCGLTTVTGPGLAPNLQGVVSGISGFGPLPYTLSGVSITVGTTPAPIESVANQNGTQSVNFQTPCEVQPGTTTVTVQVSGSSSTISGVTVFAGAPGVFNYPGPSGKAYAAVVDASNGSYVTPSNPAHRGGTYYAYVTGLGQTSPAIITNSTGTIGATQSVTLPVIAGVSNAGVPVVFSQYATGYVGVYIVGFTIPQNAPTGADQPFAIAVLVNGQLVFGNVTYLPQVSP